MKNFIKEYKNALSPKICEDIILEVVLGQHL